VEVDCFTRSSTALQALRTSCVWRLSGCKSGVFKRLKRRRLIASHGGAPYRVTREGLAGVRSQLDNR
jgi:uncharacterized protein YjhX (UPF0386 family)